MSSFACHISFSFTAPRQVGAQRCRRCDYDVELQNEYMYAHIAYVQHEYIWIHISICINKSVCLSYIFYLNRTWRGKHAAVLWM